LSARGGEDPFQSRGGTVAEGEKGEGVKREISE